MLHFGKISRFLAVQSTSVASRLDANASRVAFFSFVDAGLALAKIGVMGLNRAFREHPQLVLYIFQPSSLAEVPSGGLGSCLINTCFC